MTLITLETYDDRKVAFSERFLKLGFRPEVIKVLTKAKLVGNVSFVGQHWDYQGWNYPSDPAPPRFPRTMKLFFFIRAGSCSFGGCTRDQLALRPARLLRLLLIQNSQSRFGFGPANLY